MASLAKQNKYNLRSKRLIEEGENDDSNNNDKASPTEDAAARLPRTTSLDLPIQGSRNMVENVGNLNGCSNNDLLLSSSNQTSSSSSSSSGDNSSNQEFQGQSSSDHGVNEVDNVCEDQHQQGSVISMERFTMDIVKSSSSVEENKVKDSNDSTNAVLAAMAQALLIRPEPWQRPAASPGTCARSSRGCRP